MYDMFPGEEATASELAIALRHLKRATPPRTVHLTNLVEVTAHWTLHNPDLATAHAAFATARAAYWPYNDTDEAWAALATAAVALAERLDQFGDTQLEQCDHSLKDGTACPGILDLKGTCRYASHHEGDPK
ncbi:hypothetical protein ACWGKU_05215 [Kitasatospora sp. NPDC054768]